MNQGGGAIPLLPSIRVTQTDGLRSSELNKVLLTEERSTAPFICNLQPPYRAVPFHHSPSITHRYRELELHNPEHEIRWSFTSINRSEKDEIWRQRVI